MALGTITKPSPSGDYTAANKRVRTRIVQLTSGANYTTGGEPITPASVGLHSRIEQAYSSGVAKPTGGATARTIGFDFTAVATNPGGVTLQVYTTGSAEAASNSDQSTFLARVTFIGV